jgi:hypothetical protein
MSLACTVAAKLSWLNRLRVIWVLLNLGLDGFQNVTYLFPERHGCTAP